jgi:hypothetical protein
LGWSVQFQGLTKTAALMCFSVVNVGARFTKGLLGPDSSQLSSVDRTPLETTALTISFSRLDASHHKAHLPGDEGAVEHFGHDYDQRRKLCFEWDGRVGQIIFTTGSCDFSLWRSRRSTRASIHLANKDFALKALGLHMGTYHAKHPADCRSSQATAHISSLTLKIVFQSDRFRSCMYIEVPGGCVGVDIKQACSHFTELPNNKPATRSIQAIPVTVHHGIFEERH